MPGFISEIYSSLQGEGLCVGERQVFIRLAGCPWRCDYCDTPGSLAAAGGRAVSVEDLLDDVHRVLERHPHKTIALTGGEPLAQADFLLELLPALRRLGLTTYLETSGTMPRAMEMLAPFCDIVAMDVKLPSAVGRSFWDEHGRFLTHCVNKVFVKIVLTRASARREVEEAVRLLQNTASPPTLFLQPVTAISPLISRLKGEEKADALLQPPHPRDLLSYWTWARRELPDVRILPQMHPLWNVP